MEPQLTREEISRQTYLWDRVRGAGQGIIETTWQVFALLVAIRYFNADSSIKQFIPAGQGIGLLLTPLGLILANRLSLPIASILSRLTLGVAATLVAMAFAPSVGLFVLCVILAQIVASQGAPLMTHLYAVNYPSNQRGSRLSMTFIVGSLVAIVFGYLGGRLLDFNIDLYPVIFLASMTAALLSAWALRRIPSEQAPTLQVPRPLASLVIAWQDTLFRRMLIGWMLIGTGNLMLIPIRVEYLANPAYGVNASNATISALLVSTVLAFRVLSTRAWGVLFDRINVVTLRILINTTFMLSILLFFFSDRIWVIAIGCALLGMAFGGGGIMWTLYVTKVAPTDRVASYMSVHTFLTGVRMAMAPFIGYAVLTFAHPSVAAWIALALIGSSTFVFLPLRRLIEAKAGELEDPVNPRLQA